MNTYVSTGVGSSFFAWIILIDIVLFESFCFNVIFVVFVVDVLVFSLNDTEIPLLVLVALPLEITHPCGIPSFVETILNVNVCAELPTFFVADVLPSLNVNTYVGSTGLPPQLLGQFSLSTTVPLIEERYVIEYGFLSIP